MKRRWKSCRSASRRRLLKSIAIGFIHSYMNPDHERRARDILAKATRAPFSISSEVSPQMREFERFNTVCANAYVRPLMATYLARLQSRLRELGARCPVFLIHSGGGLVSVETATEYPVRLIESGPAEAHFRRGYRPPVWPRSRRVLRHGRHHGEDLPDREPSASYGADVRSCANLSLCQGLGNANLNPRYRDD